MTSDEKIEALTHTVELSGRMHKGNERRYNQRLVHHERLFADHEE